MGYSFVVAVDVDEVCANLIDIWLGLYNRDYNDNLIFPNLVEWNIAKFVKPECGEKIYEYLDDPSTYDNVKPSVGALEGVREIRKMGHRVVFVTSSPIASSGRKFKWLKDNHFHVSLKDYIEMSDKSLLLADFLIDDRYENASEFTGEGWLLTRPWNKRYAYDMRVNNWPEFTDIIIEESKQ